MLYVSRGISRLALYCAMRRSQALAGDASLAAHRRARDAAKEREELVRKQNIEAARTRIEAVLLKGLRRELSDDQALDGWTARFDLVRVSGDPEGVQRGPRLNTRDKSILFVDPDGKTWKRQAVIDHFAPQEEPEQEGEDDDDDDEESGTAAPVKEPPPVETDAGVLAFEVDRILDVRLDAKGAREYLVRWRGYTADDDSWEPAANLLDPDPIAIFEAKRPSLLPREDSAWRRIQQIGKEHQANLPTWGGAARSSNALRAKDASERSDVAGELKAVGDRTAALLTASAFGPASALCYVAPTDCDLGLFARVHIPVGTPICQYAGPVLPVKWQKQSGYNLGIPGGSGGVGSADAPFFINGASEQAPFADAGRALGTYANHSCGHPNAYYHWRVATKRSPHALAGALWIEATEPIPAGAEIRVNYEAEGREGQYWHALGITPREGNWKEIRLPPLPPAGFSLLHEPCPDSAAPPLPWVGERGGDARLRVLVPLLARECTTSAGYIRPEFFGVVATHLPGRSGLDCYQRWCHLTRAEPGLQNKLMPDLLPETGSCFCGTKRHQPSSGLDFNGVWVVCSGCSRRVHGDCAGLDADSLAKMGPIAHKMYRCPDCPAMDEDEARMLLSEAAAAAAAKRSRERTEFVVLTSLGGRHRMSVGEKIQAKYNGPIEYFVGTWFDGWVAAIHDDGTSDVHYADGDKEEGVARSHIKVLVTAEAAERAAAHDQIKEAAAAARAAVVEERAAAKAAIREAREAERAAARATVAAERAAVKAAKKEVARVAADEKRHRTYKWVLLSKLPTHEPQLGEKVQAKYQGSIGGYNWFGGVVTAVHDSGACDIRYDDGDTEEDVRRMYVKIYATKAEEDAARAAMAAEAAATELEEGDVAPEAAVAAETVDAPPAATEAKRAAAARASKAIHATATLKVARSAAVKGRFPAEPPPQKRQRLECEECSQSPEPTQSEASRECASEALEPRRSSRG